MADPLGGSVASLRTRIMYIENKSEGLFGPARICRVEFSKSGRTLRYNGQEFQSLKGAGFKSNYFDVATGDQYWISGAKRDGADRLYGPASLTEIDPDVHDEYWTQIRGQTPPPRDHGKRQQGGMASVG